MTACVSDRGLLEFALAAHLPVAAHEAEREADVHQLDGGQEPVGVRPHLSELIEELVRAARAGMECSPPASGSPSRSRRPRACSAPHRRCWRTARSAPAAAPPSRCRRRVPCAQMRAGPARPVRATQLGPGARRIARRRASSCSNGDAAAVSGETLIAGAAVGSTAGNGAGADVAAGFGGGERRRPPGTGRITVRSSSGSANGLSLTGASSAVTA